MAYQAKRKKLYQEEFQLVDENGMIAKRMHVELDPDVIAPELSKKYLAFVRASEEAKKIDVGKSPAEALELIGNTTTDILQAVFGDENAQYIVEFYRGRYTEMAREVLPFVFQIVIPQVRKMVQENRAAIVSGYNRKQRRLLFRKK